MEVVSIVANVGGGYNEYVNNYDHVSMFIMMLIL